MKIFYTDSYNYDLGLLGKLHPFDGTKFRRVYNDVSETKGIDFIEPPAPISEEKTNAFLGSLMRNYVKSKILILRALEVPKIPFLSYGFIDRKILTPMKWGVAGTLTAAESALKHGGVNWNLSGGYHHASQNFMEGFCIFNDIGITYKSLLKDGVISESDKILIIDTDAHHGNGNAFTFMENKNVTLVDVYNKDIYPQSDETRKRIDLAGPISTGTRAEAYFDTLNGILSELKGGYKLAFVVAGTDVLATDPLGGIKLSLHDVVMRERKTIERLNELNIPSVILGGGGYSKDSARSITKAVLECAKIK